MPLRRSSRVAPEAFVNAEGACTKAPFETPCPRVFHTIRRLSCFIMVFALWERKLKTRNAWCNDVQWITRGSFFRIVLELWYESIFTTFDHYRKNRFHYVLMKLKLKTGDNFAFPVLFLKFLGRCEITTLFSYRNLSACLRKSKTYGWFLLYYK